MRFSLVLAALAPILSVYADNILVQVGADNKLEFSPANITAKVGDTIAFQFQSKNHSVTQSTFGSPCVKQGIDSNFQFVTPGSTMLPQFSFNVTDVAPLWFYCAQTTPTGTHCGAGMVFSVNADPNSAKSFAAFQALAMGGAAASSVASAAGGAVDTATSVAGGAVETATSAIAGGVQQVTSVLPSLASEATSLLGDATSALGGAAGAAASEAAHLGAGVRAGPSTAAALLLAGAVLAREMLL